MEAARVRVRYKGTRQYVPVYNASGFIVDGTGTSTALTYDAAGYGRRGKMWRTSAAGPNAALVHSLPTLVSRSRDAVRKNPLADSIVSTVESETVGTGIKPLFKTPDAGLNRDLAELWLAWTDESDADGLNDFYGQQALAARATAEAGEVFARLRIRTGMETVPLQLQLLEPEYVPWEKSETIEGRDIRAGIEYDAEGRRAAYWMYRQHPNDDLRGPFFDALPHPVPASEVAHIFLPRRPGQIRGEPWLTRALIKLRDVDSYDHAELERKKTAALFAAFITSPDPVEFGGGTGTNGAYEADETGTAEVVWEPGQMIPLEPGQQVEFPGPVDVGGSYEAFLKSQHRALAVSGGIMYEQLTGDYSGLNERQFRAAVAGFRRRAEMWQHNMIVFRFCRAVARRWPDLAVLSNLISVPDSFGPRDIYRMAWIPQGWPHIHPVQDVQAASLAIRAGIKSRSAVVSEMGEDVEETDRQIAADNARAEALGLNFDTRVPDPDAEETRETENA